MFTPVRYRNAFLLFILLMIQDYACAVTVNFKANISKTTCDISLSKTLLSLGTIAKRTLTAGALQDVQPFVLNISHCHGVPGESLVPVIRVTGEGMLQDGKWLFRNQAASDAGSTGIILYQQQSTPVYSDPEVHSNAKIALGKGGQIPSGDQLTFYAGVGCGGSTGCASVKAGALSAAIMFDFMYD